MGPQQSPLCILKQGTGSTRHVKVPHACTPPSLRAQCRILAKLMAATSSHRRSRQWQHIQVFYLGCNQTRLNSNVRWDLKMGQRGLLDRLLVAHTTPVTSLSWRESPGINGSETGDNGMGWFASGGLDRCVKVNRCIRTSCHLLSTHIGMGSKCTGLQFPHTSQADLHTSSTIPCATCSMATGVRV